MNRIQCGAANNVRFNLQEHISHEKEILRTKRKELELSMNQVAEISGILSVNIKNLRVENDCFQIQVPE